MDTIKLKNILNPDVISATPETPLSEALSILSEKKISCLLVVENNKPVGILTERDLVKIAAGNGNMHKKKLAEVMSSPVKTVHSEMNVVDGYASMKEDSLRHLLVVDEQKGIEGIVTYTNIITEVEAILTDNRPVFEIMTREIVISKPDDNILKISKKMAENSISCIIIEDDSKPVGLITERDMARILLSGVDVSVETVSNWMSSSVQSVNLNTPLTEAIALMRKNKYRRLVVHDDNAKTIGLVTQSDIIRGIFESSYIKGLKKILQRKELELYESEERFRTFSEASDTAVYKTDLDGKCIYVNPVWLSHTDMSFDDALGDGWTNALHPDDKEKVFSSWEKMVQSKGKWGLEYRSVTSEGKVTWVFGTARPFKDKLGNITGHVGFNVNITKQKQAAEEKEKLIGELQDALRRVKTLSGLIPICANCKNIRNDKGYYEQIESYISDHSDAKFTHGVCPKCAKKLYPEFYDEKEDTGKQQSNGGHYNGDATRFKPDLVSKPNFCTTCKHDAGSSEKVSCNLIRANQREEGVFICDVYEKQSYG